MSQSRGKRNKQDQDGPPTLADIVREVTDDGRVIAEFYRDVIQGKRDDEGFEACHKIEAALQVQAIAPEVVEDAIAELAGIECHPEKRGPRPRKSDTPDNGVVVPAEAGTHPRSDSEQSDTPAPSIVVPAEAGTHPRSDSDIFTAAARRHHLLEYLADALAAPSLRDDPRVHGIVRESIDHGKTAVSFLLHVMHGTVRGFRARGRMEAARELINHIVRDELRQSSALTPSHSTGEGWGEGDSPATPARAGTQNGGDPSVTPAKTGNQTGGNPSVVPAKAGTQRSGARAGLPSNASKAPKSKPVRTEPAKNASEGTKTVRPEPVEEPAPYPIRGQCSADSTAPGSPEPHRGTYDIHQKLAQAQQDLSHPIHKFITAYEEVAEAFQRIDRENDSNVDVRAWISGAVRDDYGKYIWEYAPAEPQADRILKPKRRRRRSTRQTESIWGEHPADKARREGTLPPSGFKIWL